MSGRRIDWPAVALYTVLGAAALGFIGWVLWRLAHAVDWTAAALLGFVIIFGLLMVSFDMRGDRGEPVAETDPVDSPTAAAKPARRGRPRKAKPAESTPPALSLDPPAGPTSGRGPRNRAGRAPIAEPPAKQAVKQPTKPRPRNRP